MIHFSKVSSTGLTCVVCYLLYLLFAVSLCVPPYFLSEYENIWKENMKKFSGIRFLKYVPHIKMTLLYMESIYICTPTCCDQQTIKYWVCATSDNLAWLILSIWHVSKLLPVCMSYGYRAKLLFGVDILSVLNPPSVLFYLFSCWMLGTKSLWCYYAVYSHFLENVPRFCYCLNVLFPRD